MCAHAREARDNEAHDREEPDAAHAAFAGIAGAVGDVGSHDRSSRNRVGRDCKESAIALKLACNAIKHVSSRAYAVTIALVKGVLPCIKQPPQTWQRRPHGP